MTSLICSGCGCSLPAGYRACDGDNRHQPVGEKGKARPKTTFEILDACRVTPPSAEVVDGQRSSRL
jgi:hypothetical protein